MFDIGFWEVALIGIVTLLVVGPDRLPEVARTAGRWVLKVRRFVAGVKSDFNRELQSGDLHKILGDQKDQINELRSMVDSTRRELESSTSEAVAAAKSKFESVEELGKGAMSAKPSSSSAGSASGSTSGSTSGAATASAVTIPAQNKVQAANKAQNDEAPSDHGDAEENHLDPVSTTGTDTAKPSTDS